MTKKDRESSNQNSSKNKNHAKVSKRIVQERNEVNDLFAEWQQQEDDQDLAYNFFTREMIDSFTPQQIVRELIVGVNRNYVQYQAFALLVNRAIVIHNQFNLNQLTTIIQLVGRLNFEITNYNIIETFQNDWMERLNDGLFISTSSNLVVCLAFFLGFEDVNIYSINPDFLNLFHVFNQLDLFQRNEAFICIVNIILNRETQLIQEATPPIIYIVISSLIQVGFVDEEVIENLLTTYLNEHPEVSRDDVSIVTAMNILKCSKLKMPYKRSNDISNDKKREREDDRDDQDDAKGDDGQAGGNQEKSEDSHQMKKSTNSGGSAGSSNANREDVSKRAENKDFSEDNAKNNDISDVYFVPVEFASSIIANYAPQIVEYSIWAALNIDVVSQLVSYSPAAFEMSVDELSVCGSSLFSNMIDFSQAILG